MILVRLHYVPGWRLLFDANGCVVLALHLGKEGQRKVTVETSSLLDLN